MTINCSGKLVDFEKPLVMGILNLSEDSFYDGGKYSSDLGMVVGRVGQMLDEGADIIDIGASSSKPGTSIVLHDSEIKKAEPFVNAIRKEFPEAILSIDTYNSQTAEFFVRNYGIDIVNDISAGSIDSKMFETIASLKTPYVVMHMQGTPGNMQKLPSYKHVLNDLIKFFSEKIKILTAMGVKDIIIDPGFGFGKTLEHNYELLRGLSAFKIFDCPILVGLSRKSMIYKPLSTTSENALEGTVSANTLALLQGANIIRVHDVKAAKDTITIVDNFRMMKPSAIE